MSFDGLLQSMAGLAVGLVSDVEMTYSKVTSGTYNPASGTSAPVVTTYLVKGLKDEFSQSNLGREFTPGSLIRAGDLKVSITAPSSWTPEPGDRLDIGGSTYQVVAMRAVWGGDVPVLFELQVRR